MRFKQAEALISTIMVIISLIVCCCATGCDSRGSDNDGTSASELLPSAIIFADGNSITKKYGSGLYTNEVSGDGDGAISYASGTPAVAEVDASIGVITIRDTGTAVITAVKAATVVYASAVSSYTLTISGYELRELGPAGGLIFYINSTPSASGWKYLEAGPQETENVYAVGEDQILEWGADGVSVGSDGEGIGTGESNTALIAANAEEGNFCAATWCVELSFGGNNDWFLPSIDELFEMYTILYASSIGDFYPGSYWSSTESGSQIARFLLLTDPNSYLDDHTGAEKYQAYHVRPIRAF